MEVSELVAKKTELAGNIGKLINEFNEDTDGVTTEITVKNIYNNLPDGRNFLVRCEVDVKIKI